MYTLNEKLIKLGKYAQFADDKKAKGEHITGHDILNNMEDLYSGYIQDQNIDDIEKAESLELILSKTLLYYEYRSTKPTTFYNWINDLISKYKDIDKLQNLYTIFIDKGLIVLASRVLSELTIMNENNINLISELIKSKSGDISFATCANVKKVIYYNSTIDRCNKNLKSQADDLLIEIWTKLFEAVQNDKVYTEFITSYDMCILEFLFVMKQNHVVICAPYHTECIMNMIPVILALFKNDKEAKRYAKRSAKILSYILKLPTRGFAGKDSPSIKIINGILDLYDNGYSDISYIFTRKFIKALCKVVYPLYHLVPELKDGENGGSLERIISYIKTQDDMELKSKVMNKFIECGKFTRLCRLTCLKYFNEMGNLLIKDIINMHNLLMNVAQPVGLPFLNKFFKECKETNKLDLLIEVMIKYGASNDIDYSILNDINYNNPDVYSAIVLAIDKLSYSDSLNNNVRKIVNTIQENVNKCDDIMKVAYAPIFTRDISGDNEALVLFNQYFRFLGDFCLSNKIIGDESFNYSLENYKDSIENDNE